MIEITVILLLISVLCLWGVVLIHIYSQDAEGIQVKKCSFWVFLCHMEEHYIENCEVGKWLKDYPVTTYIQVGQVLMPIVNWYNVYEYTCYREYDNGTQTTIVSEKHMAK